MDCSKQLVRLKLIGSKVWQWIISAVAKQKYLNQSYLYIPAINSLNIFSYDSAIHHVVWIVYKEQLYITIHPFTTCLNNYFSSSNTQFPLLLVISYLRRYFMAYTAKRFSLLHHPPIKLNSMYPCFDITRDF